MDWKKLLGVALGVAGAPVTGGFSLASIPGILAAATPVLSGAAKGRGEAQQANEALGISRANADINRRRYMLEAPGERVRQSSRASMVANYQPTSIRLGAPGFGMRGESPEFEGGFNNPDMYSKDTRALANQSVHQHLLASLRGDDNVPELPEVGRSSTGDKILGGLGFGASILDAIRRRGGPTKKPIMTGSPTITTPFLDM